MWPKLPRNLRLQASKSSSIDELSRRHGDVLAAFLCLLFE